jgi:hypothetical protein
VSAAKNGPTSARHRANGGECPRAAPPDADVGDLGNHGGACRWVVGGSIDLAHRSELAFYYRHGAAAPCHRHSGDMTR